MPINQKLHNLHIANVYTLLRSGFGMQRAQSIKSDCGPLLTLNLSIDTEASDKDLTENGVTFRAKVMELKTVTTVKACGNIK